MTGQIGAHDLGRGVGEHRRRREGTAIGNWAGGLAVKPKEEAVAAENWDVVDGGDASSGAP